MIDKNLSRIELNKQKTEKKNPNQLCGNGQVAYYQLSVPFIRASQHKIG